MLSAGWHADGEANAKSSILLTGIAQGRVNMSDIDRAASNVLRA